MVLLILTVLMNRSDPAGRSRGGINYNSSQKLNLPHRAP